MLAATWREPTCSWEKHVLCRLLELASRWRPPNAECRRFWPLLPEPRDPLNSFLVQGVWSDDSAPLSDVLISYLESASVCQSPGVCSWSSWGEGVVGGVRKEVGYSMLSWRLSLRFIEVWIEFEYGCGVCCDPTWWISQSCPVWRCPCGWKSGCPKLKPTLSGWDEQWDSLWISSSGEQTGRWLSKRTVRSSAYTESSSTTRLSSTFVHSNLHSVNWNSSPW